MSHILEKESPSVSELLEYYIDQHDSLGHTNHDHAIFYKLTNYIINNNDNYADILLTLSETNAELRLFMNNYTLYQVDADKNIASEVLNILLDLIAKLNNNKKYEFTNFIWSLQGFRNLISSLHRQINGYQYQRNSIFKTVMAIGKINTNIDEKLQCFKNLIDDNKITDDLIKYLYDIFEKNISYTYDDPSMIVPETVASFDFCVLCFCFVIQLSKKYLFCDNIDKLLWMAINVVFLTIPIMKGRTERSIEYRHQLIKNIQEEIKSDTQHAIISEKLYNIQILQDDIKKGHIMLENLRKLVKYIDVIYIEQYMTNNYTILLDGASNNMEILCRVRDYFIIKSTSYIKSSNIPNMILSIIDGNKVPVHIKFEFVKLLLSHNCKEEFFSLKNSHKIIIGYIMKDVHKLKELEKIHLIDILIGLTDNIISYHSDSLILTFGIDVLEMYMDMIPGFIQQYTDILEIFNESNDSTKPHMIDDITNILDVSILLVKKLPILGKYASSYINDIIMFIDTICNTKKILSDISHPNYTNTLTIFDTVKKKYIEKIKPYMINLLASLKNYKIILDHNAYNILSNEMNITLDKSIKMINDDHDISELSDSIKYDLIRNPYYIKISENSDHDCIIDRKTLISICKTNINPFNRQYITLSDIYEYNSNVDVKKKLTNLRKKLDDLYEIL